LPIKRSKFGKNSESITIIAEVNTKFPPEEEMVGTADDVVNFNEVPPVQFYVRKLIINMSQVSVLKVV
jgi:hypothetical protein